MILPSEELLKEIMKIGEDSMIDDVEVYKNNILYAVDGQYADDINIYELMKLMKQWALSKGFFILSMIDEFGGMALASTKKESAIHDEVASEEAEAVFKICEWILKEKLKP